MSGKPPVNDAERDAALAKLDATTDVVALITILAGKGLMLPEDIENYSELASDMKKESRRTLDRLRQLAADKARPEAGSATNDE